MSTTPGNSLAVLPHALRKIDEVFHLLDGRDPVVFLDYDGTLAPIVSNPEMAVMSDETREILKKLASCTTVAIVSGRDRMDVATKVGFENLIYAGSHGYDISGPDNFSFQLPEGEEVLRDLEQADENLRKQLAAIPGAVVERKRYAIAVHYRNVEAEDVAKVIEAVDKELANHEKLKRGEGKKILELKPAADWHKGKAITWLLKTMNFGNERYMPVFIGDDITDEDALKSIQNLGVGILVGSHGQDTAASFRLDSIEEVTSFLELLYSKVLDAQNINSD